MNSAFDRPETGVARIPQGSPARTRSAGVSRWLGLS